MDTERESLMKVSFKVVRVHFRDIRLRSNGGMDFPLCQVTDGPLDTDKARLQTSPDMTEVTCPMCRKLAPERYPWAGFGRKA
jgi:hypothetical protein